MMKLLWKRTELLLLLVMAVLRCSIGHPLVTTTTTTSTSTSDPKNGRRLAPMQPEQRLRSVVALENDSPWQNNKRLLGESGESRSGDEDNYNYENGDGGGTLKDRIFGDMQAMWDSSPSSWIKEYWEVFAALVVVTFLLVGCHCYICCDICCFGKSSHNTQHGRIVKTQAEVDEEKRKKREELGEPILANADVDENGFPKESATSGVATIDPADDVAFPKSATPAVDDPVSPYRVPESEIVPKEDDNAVIIMESEARMSPLTQKSNSIQDEGNSSPTDKKQRRKRRGKDKKVDLASEVVSVWSEFLSQGFSGTFVENDEEEERHMYHQYREEKGKRRSRSRSRRKRTVPREIV